MKYAQEVKKYYRYLFSLPQSAIIVLLILVMYSLYALIFNSVNLIILWFVVTFCFTLILYLCGIVLNSPLHKLRRVLGFNLAGNMIALPIVLVLTFFSAKEYALMAGLSVFTSLFAIVFIGLNGFYKKTLLVYLIIASSTLLAYFMTYRLLLLNISIILVLGLLIMIPLTKKIIGQYSAVNLANLYFKYKLDGVRDLESLFYNLSHPHEVNAHIVIADKVVLLHPDIHFGPFGDIGSSNFPEILEEKLLEKGLIPIIFHGMGSHDRDIASYEYTVKYVDKILSVIGSNQDLQECILEKPFQIKHGLWEVLVIPFSCIVFAIISRNEKGIDDLPYSLQEYAFMKSISNKMPPLALIDAHNHELKENSINFNEVYTLVDKIIKEYKEKPHSISDYGIGYSTTTLSNAEGVLRNRISSIVFESDGERVCLIYIPGNNMEPSLRSRIIDKMRKYCDIAEVITNDEHTETGVLPGEIYRPVSYSDELIEGIERVVKESINNVNKNAKIYYGQVTMKLPLLRNNIWKLTEILEEYSKKTIALEVSYILSSIIISILFTIIV